MRFVFYILILPLLVNAQSSNWAPSGIPLDTRGITCIHVDTTEGKMYVSGNIFATPSLITEQAICVYDGSNWDTLGIFNHKIITVTTYKGEVIAAGAFTGVNGNQTPHIAKYNGTSWEPFGNFDNNIWNLKVIEDTLYAMGSFTEVDSIPIEGVAKWNDTIWTDLFNLNISDQGTVNDLIKYNDNYYVAGNFACCGDAGDITMYKNGQWQKVGDGLYGSMTWVNKMLLFDDELYIGGHIPINDGNIGNGILRWDDNEWRTVGTGIQDINNSFGSSVQIWDMLNYKNELYIVGTFGYAGNIPAYAFAKWSGLTWCGFNTTDIFYTFSAINDFQDTLYLGYANDTLEGMYVNNLPKWFGGNYVDTCSEPFTTVEEVNLKEKDLVIYPNPTKTHFYIKGNTNTTGTIELFDLTGRKVISQEVSDGDKINIQVLPEGVYLWQVENGNNVYNGKIVKIE